MKIISLNVGRPRIVLWKGEQVSTGIFKEPVTGSIPLRTLNLDGDRQADLSVHGGPNKAVYAYPAEHYDYWKSELPGVPLPWGMFGENLSTEGLLESTVNIGDRFQIGSAELMVTQPRLPCHKLGIKFGRMDFLRQFLASGRTGFYFSVVREGEVAAGDSINPLGQDEHGIKVADITRLYTRDKNDLATMRRALEVEALPQGWRDYFRQKMNEQ